MSDKTPREKAIIMAQGEKERIRNLEANAEVDKLKETREKLAKLKMKVEAFCVTKNCSWMIEFLDTSCMREYQFRFVVPGHKDILLKMGGSHGNGQWVVEPVTDSPEVPKAYTSIGEALIAAENKA